MKWLLILALLACAGCTMGVCCTRIVRYTVDPEGGVTVETEYHEGYPRGPFPVGWSPTTYLQRAETWEDEFSRQVGGKQ